MENVLDILPIGVFVLDARFQVAEVNKTLAEFFGVQNRCSDRTKRLVRERLSRIMENGYAFSARVLATYRDNTYIERFLFATFRQKGIAKSVGYSTTAGPF